MRHCRCQPQTDSNCGVVAFIPFVRVQCGRSQRHRCRLQDGPDRIVPADIAMPCRILEDAPLNIPGCLDGCCDSEDMTAAAL